MNNNVNDVQTISKALFQAWSLKSSTKWTEDNPANGQFGVTDLVVQDLLGGEILKTATNSSWHYYNRINYKIYDFTESQFHQEIQYQHI